MFLTIPEQHRDGELGKAWSAVGEICFGIIDHPETLTVLVVLGKSLHLRAPAPVLNMVAVDLMRKTETFLATLNTQGQNKSDEVKAELYEVWLKVLGVIVYFRLPVHRCSVNVRGNARCWTVPAPPP